MWAVAQMLDWKTLLFRCWYRASLVGGILSTFLVFCENNLIRIRSTSLSSSFKVQPTDKVCSHFFQPCAMFQMDCQPYLRINCSMRDGTSCINTCSRIAYPWTWRKKYCLILWMHGKGPWPCMLSCPRFVAILFREIILVVFPALKEIQISAAWFRALMWWKLLRRITTTSVSPV